MGTDSGHHHYTCAGQGEEGRPDDHTGKISRPAATGRAQMADEGGGGGQLGSQDFCVFWPFQKDPYLFPTIFGPSEHISVVPFFQIPHHLKDKAKTKLADCWIEFSSHLSNLWTKVRVLMCSWFLGLSIFMWFVNF